MAGVWIAVRRYNTQLGWYVEGYGVDGGQGLGAGGGVGELGLVWMRKPVYLSYACVVRVG